MIVIISPAKKLNLTKMPPVQEFSQCDFLPRAKTLVDIAKTLSSATLQRMMKISPALADLNKKRFTQWKTHFTADNVKQAIYSFDGDTYKGLDAYSLQDAHVQYGQRYLRILSGLYGILRPLDLIQAYRLEMGIQLKNDRGQDLYDFWQDIVTESLNRTIKATSSVAVVNCASQEYFKVINPSALSVPIYTTVFKEIREGKAKIISFCAKRARGMMARYIMENRIKNPEHIKDFSVGGYRFVEGESENKNFIFHRQQHAST